MHNNYQQPRPKHFPPRQHYSDAGSYYWLVEMMACRFVQLRLNHSLLVGYFSCRLNLRYHLTFHVHLVRFLLMSDGNSYYGFTLDCRLSLMSLWIGPPNLSCCRRWRLAYPNPSPCRCSESNYSPIGTTWGSSCQILVLFHRLDDKIGKWCVWTFLSRPCPISSPRHCGYLPH